MVDLRDKYITYIYILPVFNYICRKYIYNLLISFFYDGKVSGKRGRRRGVKGMRTRGGHV